MLGIMADSHDHIMAIRKAVNIFNKKEVSTVLHAGDLISPFTAKEYQNLDSNFEAVYGNNDGEREGLKKAYSELCLLDDFKELNLDGLKIALTHGTIEPLIKALVDCDKYDMVIRGHSHQLSVIEKEAMEINPGETCGYLSGQKTIIIFDTDKLDYEVIYL